MTTDHAAAAFPLPSTNSNAHAPGLSKREHFAALALSGLLANAKFNPTHQLDKVANCAVEAADALIDRLNMPKGSP